MNASFKFVNTKDIQYINIEPEATIKHLRTYYREDDNRPVVDLITRDISLTFYSSINEKKEKVVIDFLMKSLKFSLGKK
jgi:hypothetical protein